jgi:hypothetical protein
MFSARTFHSFRVSPKNYLSRIVRSLSKRLGIVALCGASMAMAQVGSTGSKSAGPQITAKIVQGSLVPLKGHVLKSLTPDKDMGVVENSLSLGLYMVLQRTPAQQADLDTLLARQQQPGASGYHKWFTPQQFGERFGAAESDITQIKQWLQSQGFEVTSVAHNASVINFTANAAQARTTFHTQLHYWNVEGSKYIATATEPEIPTALAKVVSGIAGLN